MNCQIVNTPVRIFVGTSTQMRPPSRRPESANHRPQASAAELAK